MYLWWSLYTLHLPARQVELSQAIQVFVVVSLVCRALLFPSVCRFCQMILLKRRSTYISELTETRNIAERTDHQNNQKQWFPLKECGRRVIPQNEIRDSCDRLNAH